MSVLAFALGLDGRNAARVDLFVGDLPLARALHEGSPAARLLARTRLGSDERDLGTDADDVRDAAAKADHDGATVAHGRAHAPALREPTSTWDALVRALTQDSRPMLERIKRAVARHTRAASVEGPLLAPGWLVTALVVAVALSEDVDASLAEIGSPPLHAGGSALTPSVAEARAAFAGRCAAHDPRFGDAGADLRGPLFEACLHLSARSASIVLPHDAAVAAFTMLSEIHGGEPLPRRLATPLFPRPFDAEGAGTSPFATRLVGRRMALLDRAPFDALVARDPRDLAAAISRRDRDAAFTPPSSRAPRGAPGTHLDTFVADLTKLLVSPGAFLLALLPAEPKSDSFAPPPAPSRAPPAGPPSSIPPPEAPDWSHADAAAALADAIERGTTTLPRARLAVARSGDAALDAIGAEMLHANAHPLASAAFAELLARSGRPRDVMRLVTYFAVAPDPSLAARVLSTCNAPELPRVLAAWLEAMLPSDGALAHFSSDGDDPDTSSAARLTACISSLSPYPHLHKAVAPLLTRVSDAPAPPSSHA